MQIGMLDHLHKSIVHFMKMHKRLDKYNAICLSVPPYHDLTTNTFIVHIMKTHKRLDKYNAIWLSVPPYHDLTPNTKSYE